MREAKRPNYYTLLGLSPRATPEEIKRRYRKLVRRYHPDVRSDKELAHQQFVRIVEAYETLSDPDRRRAYDAALAHLSQPGREATAAATAPRTPLRPRSDAPLRSAQKSQIETLLSLAERYFARGEYARAIEQCKKVTDLDSEHAAAYALWGDALLEQGEFDRAILMYSFAVQFDPRSVVYGEKLQQAFRNAQIAESRSREEAPRPFTPPAGKARGTVPGLPYLNVFLGLGILSLVLWAILQPGRALSPRIPIPLHLAISALGVGGLLGLLLAWNRWIGPFDEELVYATVQERAGEGTPVGLFLCLASLLWIYLGLVLYLVVALLNETLSRSVLTVFGLTFLIVVLAALGALQVWKPILLFGGNFVFLAVVLGWLIGSIGQKPW